MPDGTQSSEPSAVLGAHDTDVEAPATTGPEADFLDAEGSVTLATWWAEARAADTAQRQWLDLAARHSVAAHRHADDLRTAVEHTRSAATWLGLALLDAAASDPEFAAQLQTLLASHDPAESDRPSTEIAEPASARIPTPSDEPDWQEHPAGDQSALDDGCPTEPIERPVGAPEKPPLDLNPSVLANLQAQLGGARLAPQTRAQADLTATLGALEELRVEAGAEPAGALDRGSLRNQLAQAERALANEAAWAALDQEHRKLAIEWFAARLRSLQDHRALDDDPTITERIDAAMRALTRHLGPRGSFSLFCHGLHRKHGPRNTTWLHDARAHQSAIDKLTGRRSRERRRTLPEGREDDLFRQLRVASGKGDEPTLRILCNELLDLGVSIDDPRWRLPLEPHLGALEGRGRNLKELADRVGAVLAREFEAELAPNAAPQPELRDWRWLERTRGRRLLIVGGDGRQERVPKIETAFGLASAEWADLPKNAPRAKDAMVARIENGNYDFVVCLQRFVSHELTDAVWAANAEGVTKILSEGYGIGQLQRAFERFLGQD
ncbi:MAG: hypothetical protein RIT45_1426 [Pseudomonadota bacterium]|jgi:hypothetical protein